MNALLAHRSSLGRRSVGSTVRNCCVAGESFGTVVSGASFGLWVLVGVGVGVFSDVSLNSLHPASIPPIRANAAARATLLLPGLVLNDMILLPRAGDFRMKRFAPYVPFPRVGMARQLTELIN